MPLLRRRLLVSLVVVIACAAPSCADGTEQSFHHIDVDEALDLSVFVDQVESERARRANRLSGSEDARPGERSELFAASQGLPDDLAFAEAPAAGDHRLSDTAVDDGDGLVAEASSPSPTPGATPAPTPSEDAAEVPAGDDAEASVDADADIDTSGDADTGESEEADVDASADVDADGSVDDGAPPDADAAVDDGANTGYPSQPVD